MNMNQVSIGIVGTSWWADTMFLPALASHPQGRVIATCGRNRKRADTFASQWGIDHVFDNYETMIESADIDAVIVSTRNDSHYPITMKALERGLHVLCEKPLGLNYQEAKKMADLAHEKDVKHMTPFTYRFMPTTRYIHELINDGFIGDPYHLNMRYYAGFGRDDDYNWRYDVRKAGSGIVGDIGSHFLYLAYWMFGKIKAVSCRLGYFRDRPELDPKGQTYERGDELATVTMEFENGAQGVLQATCLAYEDTNFQQSHHMEFHGSGGTLYNVIDWDHTQRVSGAKDGEGPVKEMVVPDRIWGDVRRDHVHNTYKDIFRTQNSMTRHWVTAIAEDTVVQPDFHDGAHIQRVIDASVKSHKERCWINVEDIQ